MIKFWTNLSLKMKKYVTHECTSNISFLIFKHIVFRPIFSLKPEFYTAEKEISSSFQKCIGLYTLYEISQRNLTFKWHNTIDVNDDINDVTCLLHHTDVMTSDWCTHHETIAWWRHSSCTVIFRAFLKNHWNAQKMRLLAKFSTNFFRFKILSYSRLLRIFLRKLHFEIFFGRGGVCVRNLVIEKVTLFY